MNNTETHMEAAPPIPPPPPGMPARSYVLNFLMVRFNEEWQPTTGQGDIFNYRTKDYPSPHAGNSATVDVVVEAPAGTFTTYTFQPLTYPAYQPVHYNGYASIAGRVFQISGFCDAQITNTVPPTWT